MNWEEWKPGIWELMVWEEAAECDAPLALGWRLPDHVAFAVIRWWLNRLLTKEKATQAGMRHPTDLDVFTKGPTFGRKTPLKRVTATQRRCTLGHFRREFAGNCHRIGQPPPHGVVRRVVLGANLPVTATQSGNRHPTASYLAASRYLAAGYRHRIGQPPRDS